MDLRVLRQIAALEAAGSFAKAAEALGVTQPGLSKSIATFEQELGVRIVERTPQGSELTEIGRLIADRARAILDETKQLYQDAELAAGGEAGVLRIGITSPLKGRFLERLVDILGAEHPNLAIEVIVDTRGHLLDRLLDKQLDLIMRLDSPALRRAGVQVTELFQDEVAAFAHPDHPLSRQAVVTLDDLARHRTVSPAATEFEPGRGTARIERDERRFYVTNDYDALLFLATSGRAAIVCTTRYLRRAPGGLDLQRLNIDLGPPVACVAATTPAAASIPIIQRALGYARQAAAEL